VLGLGAYDVRPAVVDTDSVGYTAVTGGSRTTFATGIAAIVAAEDVIRQMKERAALIWEVEPDTVAYEGTTFTSSAKPGERLAFKDVAAQLGESVVLGTPVRRIEHGPHGVTLHGDRGRWTAETVIVAMSPMLAGTMPVPKCRVSRNQKRPLSLGRNARTGSATNGWLPKAGT